MAENHSKYMPHHPKPKFVDGGKPNLMDPMLRARGGEPTSHDGSGDASYAAPDFGMNKYEDAAY